MAKIVSATPLTFGMVHLHEKIHSLFQLKQLCHFFYLPPTKWSTHKGKNLLLEEQILSFMSRPLLERP